MQAALIEKSNETSEKLMNDVKRVRSYIDQDAVKKGYV